MQMLIKREKGVLSHYEKIIFHRWERAEKPIIRKR
jgi:hypothetical protein